jgi:stage V sporulation protein R
MRQSSPIDPSLKPWAERIEALARSAGLDFFDVVFEMVEPAQVNALAAYGGFPVRYPSWRFGMEFERMEKGRQWGLSKIYELVINNDPTYAYLVRANSMMEQKLVMAHVFGHADFFRHNCWFQATERNMLDRMAHHGSRVRRFVDAYGQNMVDQFLDQAISLDNLIDPFLPARELARTEQGFSQSALVNREAPFSSLEVQHKTGGSSLPTYDVLGHLAEYAPLEPWQRELMRLVRAEAYYFVPQRMTKIMNEGWASFWHSRMLTHGLLETNEIVDFADCHSGATAAVPGQLNPYKLGIELFRYAEEKGLDIFQLRKIHNDASFIDALVDEEFAARCSLFVYDRNPKSGVLEVADRGWEEVKSRLLQGLSWGGAPRIELLDDDHEGRGELLLRHHFEGRELDLAEAGEVLKHLARLWRRPVHLLTTERTQTRLVTSDGEEIQSVEVSDDEPSQAA